MTRARGRGVGRYFLLLALAGAGAPLVACGSRGPVAGKAASTAGTPAGPAGRQGGSEGASSPPAPPHASASAPASAADPAVGDAVVARAAQELLAMQVELFPEEATMLGVHTRDGELDDRSPHAVASQLARQKALLESVRRRFAQARLSPSARTDAALIESALATSILTEESIRPAERKPDLYTTPMSVLFLMTARTYAPPAQRARDVMARMSKLPQTIAAARANLRSPPRVWTQVAIEKAASAATFFDEVRAFLLTALPDQRERVEAATRTAKEAYAQYKVHLETEVLPRSTGAFAIGRPLFDRLLREAYFLDDDADALHALGERSMQRTRAEMGAVARRIDPRATSWVPVVAALKKKHPAAADLLGAYRREVARARAFLVTRDVVPFPPNDDVEVVETPPYLRSTTLASYDQAPPFDASTKGFFFVTPVERSWAPERQEEWLRESDEGDIVDTVVHEAYPGHHLQLSWARRHPSVVRKLTDAALFSEGWALYGEELMAELGYYDDEKRLMQLEWTLVRAARIVVDVGLHTRGMTVEQAVKILADDVHLERALAENEVKRFTATPTQPLSYLVGREMIFRMRGEYMKREGAQYSLKRFHTELLSRGTIPPGLIAREMFGG